MDNDFLLLNLAAIGMYGGIVGLIVFSRKKRE
jgi:hypothetical protein